MNNCQKVKKRLTWNDYYDLACVYYKHYGYLEMYNNFCTNDGINIDNCGIKLGKWLSTQRYLYVNGKLSKEKIDKLGLIGFNLELDSLEVDFQKYYFLLVKYKEKNGNCFVKEKFRTTNGFEYDSEGLPLGAWLISQKKRYKKGLLNDLKTRKLRDLGVELERTDSMVKWDNMYSLALAYHTYYKHINVPKGFYTNNGITFNLNGQDLYMWLVNQRIKFLNGKLNNEQVIKLNSLGFVLDENPNEIRWQEMYLLATAFYNYYHHLNISKTFKTSNGYDYDPDGKNLGHWFITQKSANKNGDLSLERKRMLLSIGMNFEYNYPKNHWYKMYLLLKKYYEYYGNLEIDPAFKTIDGYEYNENGYELKIWFVEQIERYLVGSLKKEYVIELEKLGIDLLNYNDDNNWDLIYSYYVNYVNHYKINTIPSNFITSDGINIDAKGINLSEWLDIQKVKYDSGKLSLEHQEKLKKIGFLFATTKNFNDAWNEWFKLALSFYKQNGHLEVKKSFKTLNGYEFNSNGKRLGLWIFNQRNNYNNGVLKSDRKTKLESIGMRFEKTYKTSKWLTYYKLLEIYYNTYHHFNIPTSFKTVNGYEYDPNGLDLGNWLSEQISLLDNDSLSYHYKLKLNKLGIKIIKSDIDEKWLSMLEVAKSFYIETGHLNINIKLVEELQNKKYEELLKWITIQRNHYKNKKLSLDKVNSLNNIRMIWDVRKNTSYNKIFCVEKNILYTKYSKELQNIPYRELEAKYNYLISKFIPIIDNDEVNEIFFMGDEELREKHNISLFELINIYGEDVKLKVI